MFLDKKTLSLLKLNVFFYLGKKKYFISVKVK
ncbi:MAG: Unknown protein [uncultured Aureispira sp.]|uniref:Uncharacterized protein n=1 Tax=uncultured Aureispira sp. TaxID=1331704 RepID=A0A6S6S7T5_9BACT|nr:MAG: Unknown protein [uncultured Aureispira sp.]